MKLVIACIAILCSMSACTTLEEREEHTRDEIDPLKEHYEAHQDKNRSQTKEQDSTRESQPLNTESELGIKPKPKKKAAPDISKPLKNTSQSKPENDPLDYELPIDKPKHSPQKSDHGEPSNPQEDSEENQHASAATTDKKKEEEAHAGSQTSSSDTQEEEERAMSSGAEDNSLKEKKQSTQSASSNSAPKQHDQTNPDTGNLLDSQGTDSVQLEHSKSAHNANDLVDGSAHQRLNHSGADHYHQHGNVIIKAKKSVKWNIQRKIDRQ